MRPFDYQRKNAILTKIHEIPSFSVRRIYRYMYKSRDRHVQAIEDNKLPERTTMDNDERTMNDLTVGEEIKNIKKSQEKETFEEKHISLRYSPFHCLPC